MNDEAVKDCSAVVKYKRACAGLTGLCGFDWLVPQMGGLHQDFMRCWSF